jgi:hypothetical protein
MNELISHYVKEEERLKNEPVESVNVAMTSKNKGKKKRKAADKDKDKGQNKQKDVKGKHPATTSESDICFFCKCANYQAWLAKKDTIIQFQYQ